MFYTSFKSYLRAREHEIYQKLEHENVQFRRIKFFFSNINLEKPCLGKRLHSSKVKFMRSFIGMTSILQPLIFFEQIWILLLQLQITISHLIISLWKFICSNLSSYKLCFCNQFACSIWFWSVWAWKGEFVFRILKLISIILFRNELFGLSLNLFSLPTVY